MKVKRYNCLEIKEYAYKFLDLLLYTYECVQYHF